MSEDFSPREIEILTSAEAVRRRTHMYFDAEDPDIAATLTMQSLCHAIDDAMDGRCTAVLLRVEGPRFEVRYDSGMPLEPDSEHPQWTVAEVFLRVHAACHSRKRHLEVGSEFCRIGLAVLNAVCSELTAEIDDAGMSTSLRFERGELVDSSALRPTERRDGTRLCFTLDASILRDVVPREAALRHAIDALHARFQGLAISMEYGSAAFDQPTIER
ncbi:hypothetical protein ACSFBM_26090 [Variovorax sp. GB1R11]|uniref:hypothetical protein n=1 Tax=Variovorax sp. GB1R11 TaxID=3443741 RepID=UPI003F452765